jgi:hypothetical protein
MLGYTFDLLLLPRERAQKKIREFAELRDGWCYGEGHPPSESTVKAALELNKWAIRLGLGRTNAFPGLDGEITVVVYVGDHDYEFRVESDGQVSYQHDLDGNMLEQRLLSLKEAKSLIQKIAPPLAWTIFDFSTPDITTKRESVSVETHLVLSKVVSPSSVRAVSRTRDRVFVRTYASTTESQPLGSLQSSGFFDLKGFRRVPA